MSSSSQSGAMFSSRSREFFSEASGVSELAFLLGTSKEKVDSAKLEEVLEDTLRRKSRSVCWEAFGLFKHAPTSWERHSQLDSQLSFDIPN